MEMKDPAFLFYSSDFMIGTQFFTDEQVGKYVRLLCAQHQHGHLTKKQVQSICSDFDEEVLSKFTIDSDGKYYQKRLKIEIEKRAKFSESRRQNASGGKKQKNTSKASEKHMYEHMHEHMGNEDEDVNENINETEKAAKVPIKKIMEKYNSTCGSLPKIKNISGDRETHVRARVKEYGLDAVYETFVIAGQSDFLTGNNDRGWKATFDWLMNTVNMSKVLERRYSNEKKQEKEKPKYGTIL